MAEAERLVALECDFASLDEAARPERRSNPLEPKLSVAFKSGGGNLLSGRRSPF
jgi:hypothetical protein